MSKYCLFLIVIYYLTGGNNSMSRFFKFGKLHFLITEVNLLNQLKLAKRVNLFDYSLEELQAVHEYWRSMNRYSKQVLNKEKVA